ncbi:hypothetical protein HN446_00535 [bacterium]|jgi:hypothetical protein|nr:hypothetical protein [bacterium]
MKRILIAAIFLACVAQASAAERRLPRISGRRAAQVTGGALLVVGAAYLGVKAHGLVTRLQERVVELERDRVVHGDLAECAKRGDLVPFATKETVEGLARTVAEHGESLGVLDEFRSRLGGALGESRGGTGD